MDSAFYEADMYIPSDYKYNSNSFQKTNEIRQRIPENTTQRKYQKS